MIREANPTLDARPQPAADLPDGLTVYQRTPEFTKETIPKGLLNAHATKTGVWGRIQVTHGTLMYRIVDTRRQPREMLLSPEQPGVVEPGVLHEVEPSGPVEFFVEFLR
jgi:tellurite resistance-related uncharacterized protein